MWGREGRFGRWSRGWIEPEISLDPLAVDSHAGLRLPEGTRSSPPTATVLREMALFNYRLIYRRNETITNFYQDGPLARPRARRAWPGWATRPKALKPEVPRGFDDNFRVCAKPFRLETRELLVWGAQEVLGKQDD